MNFHSKSFLILNFLTMLLLNILIIWLNFIVDFLFISFGITIYEFIEMDKHPEAYKNPRYQRKKSAKKNKKK